MGLFLQNEFRVVKSRLCDDTCLTSDNKFVKSDHSLPKCRFTSFAISPSFKGLCHNIFGEKELI